MPLGINCTANYEAQMEESNTKRRVFGNAASGTAAMTLSEIGKMFGVSLQSVQSIEQRAIRKIKAAIESEAAKAGMTVEEWLLSDDE